MLTIIKQKNQTKSEIKRANITTVTTEMKRIIRDYYEQIYTNWLDNLKEIDKFLETHNLPRLIQEEMENLNRQITSMEIKLVAKNILTKRSS